MQPLGGTTEVQLVGHGQKRPQLFNIHGVGPLSALLLHLSYHEPD